MLDRLSLPPYLRAALVVGLGGFLFGSDTGTIGPVTKMTTFVETFGEFSATIHGLIISSILIPAALTSLISGNVADIYGRLRTIMFGEVVFGIGAAIEASAPNIGAFVCGRIIAGIGEGFYLSLLVVYVCEISPAKNRGPLASLPQFGTVLGLASGYFISYGTSRIASSASWRIPLAVQAFLAFSFAVCCTTLPPSPRWLLSKNRKEEAFEAASRLGIKLEEQTIIVDGVAIEETPKPVANGGLGQAIKTTFTDLPKAFEKSVRNRTILGCVLMGMQQFSGIDGVLYYAPLLFEQAGLSSEKASFLASGISAIVILVATIPATIFADRWGRRSTTIYGGTTMAACMALIGALYASGKVYQTHGAARWVIVGAIYVFAGIYSMTWAIGMRVYASEIQPIRSRALASSWGQSANWGANFIVALTTPIFLDRSTFGVYFLFSGCLLTVAIGACFLMPETRGRSLEEIDREFSKHALFKTKATTSTQDAGIFSTEKGPVATVSPVQRTTVSRSISDV
ncbi:putative MFS sugar transporter [Aaosphaeria arxii CBS 175.79]|uniref:Putative MFS sugar transporter n=1 Tax=Aaosphaeria arxii CBS 175.79 TaxID=1450172 RepID=A0A6A5XYD9_9PLEO|nr:putative MFS sugar transporter [Aaosphaeria arxii CBS 175.79]KAF2017943.1 putative MFS sugar transporter [Aaosphaeria arxii CBS 175.79]